ncbi:MAG: DUF4244 domain-containing protein [Actinomycetota bacterium]
MRVVRALCRGGRQAERGMATAEYAVGTVAACGFAGILYKVLTSSDVLRLLTRLLARALSLPF